MSAKTSDTTGDTNVLEVKGLQTVFFTNSGLFRAVDNVSFHVKRGETLAIVGESGCGKSVSALSIMRLVPNPPGRIVGGEIFLDGTDLLALDEARMREIRGNRISMIFQQPTSCLNPVYRIGDQISEVLMLHRGMGRDQAMKRTIELLSMVGIPEPYPSWGRMLSESAAEYVRTAPWLVIFPGLAISFVVFGVNLLGDALRDLLDPRQRS